MLTQELMREVRRLQVRTRRRVEGLFAGEYHTAFKGRGIEFADVREYEPGDDVRAIDWNVTARTGRPFIKRFVEERELSVVLAVDLSGSGEFSSSTAPGARLKSRIAIEAAAALALSASSNHDRVGLCLFTSEVELFLAPNKGRANTLRLLRELLSFRPRARGTDIAGAVLRLGHVLKRRGTIDFGRFSREYDLEFERKWVNGARGNDEEPLGSQDIQALADLGTSFNVVREMSIVPVPGRRALLGLLVVAVAPMIVPAAVAMSVPEVVRRLLGAFLGRGGG